MVAQDGFLPHLIMDGSKEQTLGKFRKKARQSGCQNKKSELYSPCHIMTEGAIKELKRGSDRKMMRNLSPAKLWYHYI